MLGFADGWIALAYILCILSTLLCVVYGLVNWHRGGNNEDSQVKEEINWEEKDLGIENGK